jgi:ArsR family transcriptional regulator
VEAIELLAACCGPRLTRAPLSESQAEALAESIGVIAEPARLRLLSIIAASPGGEACVCDLTDLLDLSQPTVSHHLRVLQDAGLVEREQRGRWAFYRLPPDSLRLLGRVLPPGERSRVGTAPQT